jgi:DNA-binding NarL/FixJ family response regulator
MKQKVQILIADDHEIFREGLKAVLSSHSEWSICAEVSNGREAVAKATELRPDVAILDFSMPELNGVEAARRIHAAAPRTAVIMLTTHSSDRLAHEALAAGVKGFILKSEPKQQIVSAVQALSEGKTFFTQAVSSLLLNAYLEPGTRPNTQNAPGELLTQREREVVQLIAEGRTTKEIATKLGVSEKTVESHRSNILRRLGLHSAVDLVRYAIRNHLIEP